MFKTKCTSIKHQYKKLGACFNKQKGMKNVTLPTFDIIFLSSSKQLKIEPEDFIFPIKHKDICNYNRWYLMSGGLLLDDIIMNLFSDNTEQKINSAKTFFSKIKDDNIYLYQGSFQDYRGKKMIAC